MFPCPSTFLSLPPSLPLSLNFINLFLIKYYFIMNLGISSFVGDVLLFLRNFQKKICIQCPQILLYFILIICLNTSFSYLHQYSMEPFNLRQFIFLQLDEIYYYFFKYCLLSFVSLSCGPHVDVGPICYTPSAVTSSIQSLLLRFPLRMPSCSSSGCSPT